MTAPVLYPDAEAVVMTLLEPRALTVTSLPPGFDPPIILVERVGGAPDLENYSDYPQVQVTTYGVNRPEAWAIAALCQVDILASPLTVVAGVLIEDATIRVGGEQQPDLDPDDRRVSFTCQLSLDLRPAFALRP